ncbi:hypothetical protein WJX84_007895 [Apatococcus fuscideae]|uniref:Uncharacterized protein n=1 Tax=Apatococcus fuscideae TaxID=2026836 RepID=A0AAW1SRP0_9CHLO
MRDDIPIDPYPARGRGRAEHAYKSLNLNASKACLNVQRIFGRFCRSSLVHNSLGPRRAINGFYRVLAISRAGASTGWRLCLPVNWTRSGDLGSIHLSFNDALFPYAWHHHSNQNIMPTMLSWGQLCSQVQLDAAISCQ